MSKKLKRPSRPPAHHHNHERNGRQGAGEEDETIAWAWDGVSTLLIAGWKALASVAGPLWLLVRFLLWDVWRRPRA